ncbi:MAG: YcxB family protein [Clostridiaceae bacterium]|nr:YcxB family protein [Clostridiaceae bacterium]
MFESTTIIDIQFMKKITKHLMPKILRKLVLVIFVLLPLAVLLSLIKHDYDNAISSILLFLVVILAIAYLQIVTGKRTIARIKENTGKEAMRIKTWFDETGMNHENLEMNEKINFKYDVFSRFIETKDYFLLITKAKQLIPVNKKALDADKISECRQLILNKCTSLKEITIKK